MISNPAGRLAGLRFKFYVTPIKKRGCVISHIPYALKGQKLLAQGSALGFRIDTTKSP